MRESACFLLAAIVFASTVVAEEIRSHPPLRPLPEPSDRALTKGPALFVDTAKGNDENSGTKESPWKTISQALGQISAGETLYLRGGTYYERVYCAVAGTAEKPITICSYPGEIAIIDGAFREFFENAPEAWELFPKGAAGEFRSRRAYKNLRNIHGRFADSMVGLQVYYYIEDLRGSGTSGRACGTTARPATFTRGWLTTAPRAPFALARR